MAYDPKKKRPKSDPIDSVVDEMFGSDKTKPKTTKKKATTPAKSKAAKSKSVATPKKVESKKNSAEASKKEQNHSDSASNENLDNVHELYPEQKQETPLVMQPQVWIALALSAITLFVIVKLKRKS